MSLVMVVDDMAVVREPIAASLRAAGHRALCAAEGREAIAVARTALPDVIVLDLAMPGVDGMQVLRAIRADDATANTPVILLSATADRGRVVEAARLGVREFLLKSNFSLPELLARVSKCLKLAKAAKANRDNPNADARDPHASGVADAAGDPVQTAMPDVPKLLTRDQSIARATKVLSGRTLRGVVAEVIELAASPDSDLSQLAAVIGRDSLIAGRVLQAANSACYASARGPVSTLPEAVRNIGCSTVRGIAAALGVFDAMPPSDADGYHPIRSWQHALAVATLCERFAPDAERSRAYLIGLCHDLGEIMFRSHFHAEYGQVLQAERETGNRRDDLERVMMGISHGELVNVILRCLGLPSAIREPIEEYHRGVDDSDRLAKLLRLADIYANGMLLASSDGSPAAPFTTEEVRDATGHDHPGRPDATAVCGEIFSLTTLFAKFPDAEKNPPMTPPRKRPVRVIVARDPGLSSLDPIVAAVEALADVTLVRKLPTSEQVQEHQGLIVVARSVNTKGFRTEDIEAVSAARPNTPTVPLLRLCGEIPEEKCVLPPIIWPVPVKTLTDFVNELSTS